MEDPQGRPEHAVHNRSAPLGYFPSTAAAVCFARFSDETYCKTFKQQRPPLGRRTPGPLLQTPGPIFCFPRSPGRRRRSAGSSGCQTRPGARLAAAAPRVTSAPGDAAAEPGTEPGTEPRNTRGPSASPSPPPAALSRSPRAGKGINGFNGGPRPRFKASEGERARREPREGREGSGAVRGP